MILLYFLATFGLYAMAPPLYRAAVRNGRAWKARDKTWQSVVLAISSLLLLITTLAWLYLGFVTLGSWVTSLNAARPKPPFILLWMIGFFVYGLGISFVGSLHSLATREYEKDSFWS